ncbi:MAG: DUF4249 domain-containing protein, partial [Marinirhabdus sp.]|nr:DUF4249 domain-containing protein [Marinirhabdus sp.]
MKRLIYLLLFVPLCWACEDVVEVDLNESAPKLVIDAKLTRDIASGDSDVFVQLSTTAPFFDNVIPPVTDAVVTLTDANGTITLNHTENGIYAGTIDVIAD